jgi:hypothetical protein
MCTIARLGTVPVTASFTVTLATQTLPAANAWQGFGWPVTKTFTAPADWPTGLYQLSANGQAVVEFVVVPAEHLPYSIEDYAAISSRRRICLLKSN